MRTERTSPPATATAEERLLDRRAFMGRALGAGAFMSALACPFVGTTGVATAAPSPGGSPATGPGSAEAGPPRCHGAEQRGMFFPREARGHEGRFGFMFPRLAAFEPPDELLAALAVSMEEPHPFATAADNPRIPAGFTFLSQFVDHDITSDATPIEDQQADPNAIRNFRSPRYDLDSVYGRGPVAAPELYDPTDPDKLAVVRHSGIDDLPRDDTGRAYIGDARDDQNLITAQIHLAMRKFHNALVDHVRALGAVPSVVFDEARRLARWHYQWVVLHDLLPRLVGAELVAEVLGTGADRPASPHLAYYRPRDRARPMMPVEFSGAAYRFGHSMIRPGYQMNDRAGALFFGERPAHDNLNGSRRFPPELVIDWHHFYDLPGRPAPQRARRIDTDLSFPLFRLPSTVIPPPDTRISLAERNLIRGKRLGLPSGQAVASEVGVRPLTNEELGLSGEPGWRNEAPLWFYVLKEAELYHGGERLGAVGGRIVAEVLVGLCHLDATSYLAVAPGFVPSPPVASTDGVLTMGDLLTFAGVA